MILNTAIFNTVVEMAKAKSANNPAVLRAIERAVREINRSKYWAFDGKTLRILSTTSKKLYVVTAGACVCEATGICKHRAARQLLQRYHEQLAVIASPSSPTERPASIPAGTHVHTCPACSNEFDHDEYLCRSSNDWIRCPQCVEARRFPSQPGTVLPVTVTLAYGHARAC